MQRIEISQVSISDTGSLLIQPADYSEAEAKLYPYIYRAATGVSWNEAFGAFASPAPKEWNYCDWFRNIADTVSSELGLVLVLTSKTVWRNVPPEVRQQIEGADA